MNQKLKNMNESKPLYYIDDHIKNKKILYYLLNHRSYMKILIGIMLLDYPDLRINKYIYKKRCYMSLYKIYGASEEGRNLKSLNNVKNLIEKINKNTENKDVIESTENIDTKNNKQNSDDLETKDNDSFPKNSCINFLDKLMKIMKIYLMNLKIIY